jgi:Domain of unknown function (DUF4440)
MQGPSMRAKAFTILMSVFCFGLVAAIAEMTISQTSHRTEASVTPATHEENQQSLQETLVAMEKQSWVAWKNHDANFFRGFLSDDHLEVGFTGVANKSDVVKSVESPMCVVSSYVVDNFHVVSLSADLAVVTYHESQDTKCNAVAVPSPAWVSSLYIKREGRWLNVLYQQTKDLTK